MKVTQMFEDMKMQLTDWQDDDQIRAYLEALLEKRAFDKRGLIGTCDLFCIRPKSGDLQEVCKAACI